MAMENAESNSVHRFMAIHEAGHAVAHKRLFGTIKTSKISIERLEGTISRFTHEELIVPMDTPDGEAERLFENEAVCGCAGYAAILVAGYPEEQAVLGCEDEFEEAGHRLELAKAKAVELMRDEENIRAVRRIAEELLRRRSLDGEHAGISIDLANGEMSEEEYRQYLCLRGESPS